MRWRDVPGYIVAQAAGGLLGVWAAHLMLAEPVLQVSQHIRAGGSQLFSECVASFGLLSVIWGCALARAFTNTFAGIRPADTPGFMAAQLAGAFAATFLFRWLVPSLPKQARDVVVPHTEKELSHGR
jgi:glycerol uptake facilitator-like aquaporin